LIPAIDPAILTQPSWLNVFLTPGASFVTRTPLPISTSTLTSTSPTTISSATNPVVMAKSPTNTLVYVPPTHTSVSNPVRTSTSTRTPSAQATSTNTLTVIQTLTATQTATVTATPTPTATGTNTSTPTETATGTATATPTATSVPLPPEIGTNPDSNIYTLASGGTLTLNITTFVNGDIGVPDLVYYEFDNMGMVYMDWVIIQIGDGLNWYTVFHWGDEIADMNTNMDFNILPPPTIPPLSPQEADARAIPLSSFRNNSGIEIDLDPFAPQGTYSWIRITAPMGDADNQLEIDAIESLP